jgi:flagellar motor switch protein FliN/FliY
MSEEISNTQNKVNSDGMNAAMVEGGNTEAAENSNNGNDYERADFKNLNDSSEHLTTSDANLDVILDIPVTLSMEIGRTEIPIHNLLQLNQGSVVELDRLAGEPMDVLINGTLIAHGEVVVINEKFGIRLTDVVSPSERVKKLK